MRIVISFHDSSLRERVSPKTRCQALLIAYLFLIGLIARGRSALCARRLSSRGGALFCEHRGERVDIGRYTVTYSSSFLQINRNASHGAAANTRCDEYVTLYSRACRLSLLYQGEAATKPETSSMLTQCEADHQRLASITEEGRFNRSTQFRNDNSKATACMSGKLLQALPCLDSSDVDEALMPL